jgi:ribosome-binding protein aMBF1 (putative translation factor)
MCSIFREPRREDDTTCTAVAPDAVFTVRTYGTGPLYGHGLVRKSASAKPATRRSAQPDHREPQIVSQVRNGMARRTGGERYFEARAASRPEYQEALEAARSRIAAVDGLVRALDERRRDLGLSKAELARQAGMRPEVVRRILGAGQANPTLSTVVSLASAMSLDITIRGRADHKPSGAPETPRRTA